MATSIDNTSAKYKDIISKFGTLTRKTVGEKNLNKKNKTILLVGETGTGKSTLINTLLNYTMGVKFEDNNWFEIVEREKKSQSKSQTSDEARDQSESQTSDEARDQSESQTSDEARDQSESQTSDEARDQSESQTSDEARDQSESQTSDEKGSQSESQTSDVIVYQIFGFEDKTLPFSLTIIDTPGYGDTRGIEHDVVVSQRLFDLFRSDDGVHEIDAVGLVMKASENRVSDRLKYVFDSVTSLFGKDLEENIVALITHSDGITPENALKALKAANIKCAKNEKNQPVHFLFNNRQTTQRTEETEFALEFAWKVTERGMKQFTDFLEKSTPQKLITTVEVMNAHIRITACIHNLQDRIQLIELKQKKIEQIKEALKKHEQEMKKNKDFTVEVDEDYKDKEYITGGRWVVFYKGAVTCNICKENCHFPGCTIAQSPGSCLVMKGGRCTSCTKKCPASDHVKKNWIYVTKTRKVQKTLKDVKDKYDKTKAKCEKKKSLLENLQTEMEKLKAERTEWLEEVYQHVLTLEKIALNVNSMSTHVHLDFLIEKMKERGDTEKVQKLEEMKHRGDEGIVSKTLRNMFGKLKAAGKAFKDAVM